MNIIRKRTNNGTALKRCTKHNYIQASYCLDLSFLYGLIIISSIIIRFALIKRKFRKDFWGYLFQNFLEVCCINLSANARSLIVTITYIIAHLCCSQGDPASYHPCFHLFHLIQQ